MVILLIYYWLRKENMEHYITEIRISRLRHLKDIIIPLNPENRQNLIITGKNGSGKTSLLLALRKYLKSINDGQLMTLYTTAFRSRKETGNKPVIRNR